MVKKIIFGIGLCVVIGFTIPFIMSKQNLGQNIDVEDLKKQFEQELEMMQEQTLRESYEAMWDEHMEKNPQELDDLLGEIEKSNNSEVDINPNVDAEEETTVTPSSTTATTAVADEVDFVDVETIPLSDGEVITEKIVKDQWVNQKIQIHKDQISDSDLGTGAGIYNKLDTNYLFGLAEGGLTLEEEEEVKAYLRANLSEAELGTAIELYSKYVHLLN
ncbi:MAG: hypothetical protein CVU98_04535 [Firmicutes bacterium HGW-Firmicutes-3]|jgi:hypothetical protein|nr:MAG: hypothetical protein CVU98_04535 [Firmicutes bacterium HGW-Firmicutes-3]